MSSAPPPPPPGAPPAHAKRIEHGSVFAVARHAGSGSPGRNVLLIERIHELEEQLQELRDGAPFVEEATVRSFLTQIDLAYTEDLEMQAKVLREQLAEVADEKEQLAARLEEVRTTSEKERAQMAVQLADARRAAAAAQSEAAKEDTAKLQARCDKLSRALERQRVETERAEDQRDAADKKRVATVRKMKQLEQELHAVRAKQTAELEHMAEVKTLWKGVVDTLKAENQGLAQENEKLKSHKELLQKRVKEMAAAQSAATPTPAPPVPQPTPAPEAVQYHTPQPAHTYGAVSGGMANGGSGRHAQGGRGVGLRLPGAHAMPHGMYSVPPPAHSAPATGAGTQQTPTSAYIAAPQLPGYPPANAVASAASMAANQELAAMGMAPLREDSFAGPMDDTLPGGFSMTALGLPPDLMATIPSARVEDDGSGGGLDLSRTGGSAYSTGGGGDPLQGQIDDLSARMAQETQRTIQRMQQLQQGL